MLKPYWKKHKWQKRLAVIVLFILSPLLFTIYFFMNLWEACSEFYGDVAKVFKEE